MKLGELITRLANYYNKEISFLEYNSPFELLIAVILSARTTDRQVNSVTPELFRLYPGPGELAAARQEDVEQIIKPLGFFSVKAAHIIKSAELLSTEYNYQVPESYDELLRFPGIGRKSANVVRGHIFGLPAIIVDTHFGRVVRRLGLTAETNPEKVERAVSSLVPENEQMGFSMRINKLGRDFCHARKPGCDNCPLRELCPKYI